MPAEENKALLRRYVNEVWAKLYVVMSVDPKNE